MNDVTWIWLSRNYTLLKAFGQHGSAISPNVGSVLWDAYPDARETFHSHYEAAWNVGHSYSTVLWRGSVTTVNANVVRGKLVVSIKSLPLDGLEETLRLLLAELQTRDRTDAEADQRPVLRLVR